MQPTFADSHNGSHGILLCPNCEKEHLRHDTVEVFDREEDADSGIHVAVENGKVTIDRVLKDNPSSRRHGVLIKLVCEGCSARLILSIAQHKGSTEVDLKH